VTVESNTSEEETSRQAHFQSPNARCCGTVLIIRTVFRQDDTAE
jgi:hypothetical protein